MKFESFWFYTNQRALKNYLVNYKIEPAAFKNERNITLSDIGQNFLIFWKKEISSEIVLKYCKTEPNDTPVVLKVLLPCKINAEIYYSCDNKKEADISESESAVLVKIFRPISFFNVTDIFYVDNKINFQQGDTTLIIPDTLIRDIPYETEKTDDADVLKIIKVFLDSREKTFPDNEDEDDESIDSLFCEIDEENDITVKIIENSRNEDKIIAAEMMFIQGRKNFDGILTPRTYSILDDSKMPFAYFIKNNIYKNVPDEIIEKNTETLSRYEFDYTESLMKRNKGNELFSNAVNLILNNNYAYDEKERFLCEYIESISEIALRDRITVIFGNKRARDCIDKLQYDMPELIPIYFLYTFFEYGLDRFCDNITEFGLDKKGFENITLSLWALLHGPNDIYAEYKNILLLYELSKKEEKDFCIGYDDFSKINKIIREEDSIKIDNIFCCYKNYDIEYYYCFEEREKKIKKLIDKLDSELKNIPYFRYKELRDAIKTRFEKPSNDEIFMNKEIIHKKYMQLSANPQKNKKSKSKYEQTTFFD